MLSLEGKILMEIKFDNKGIEIEVKSRIKLISQINFLRKETMFFIDIMKRN